MHNHKITLRGIEPTCFYIASSDILCFQPWYIIQTKEVIFSCSGTNRKTMKLLTHNMLTSKSMKTVTTGYPLIIQARDVKVMEVDFKPEFVSRIIPKIDWDCLCRAAEELGHLNDLPKSVPDNYENDHEFLKKAHHVMLEVIYCSCLFDPPVYAMNI